ncbi:leucine-rich repeat protein [Companilactobacillus crustorum]|uniref:leucine-rich repeat protein n=1 Tax=Companilactobacillus crustorum TaxID=392416 RepID=UPI0009579670|nr:leucine-rich repeat protein [Companilactobacillus crustorum]APU70961.1 hypothetical protein BI355_0638 [Companilactobacillus crustorum]
MTNKKMIDRKELLLATGAAVLGVGTTFFGHQMSVQAAENTGTTTSTSVNTSTNSETATVDTNANSKSDPVSTKTETSPVTVDNKTVAKPATSSNLVNSSVTVVPAVIQTTTVTTGDSSTTQPVSTTTPIIQPIGPSSNVNSGTESTQKVPTVTTVASISTPALKPLDTTAVKISSNSGYTDANDFTWSTDDTDNEAALTGSTASLTDNTISIPTTITVTPNGTTTGKDYAVTSIGDNAFLGNKTITSVKINNGITNIGNSAFAYSKVQNLDLTNNTTLQNIGNLAFVSDQIKQVDLPDSVENIGDNAFTYNSALQTIVLPQNLKSLGKESFAVNNGLKSVDFSKDSNLLNVGDQAFSSDQSLTSIDLSHNNQLQTLGQGAFIYDSNLSDVKLPDSLKTIDDQAFLSNVGLKSIKFGKGLTTIGKQAFTYDENLNYIDLSAAQSLNLIDDDAFEYSGLTGNLSLPDSVTTIGKRSFAGDHLTSLNLGTNLQTIGASAFAYNQLKNVLTLPDTITTVGQEAFISNQLTGVTSNTVGINLGSDAFSYNRITEILLPKVTLGKSVYNINPATQQLAAIFTDSAHTSISDYFNINIGGITEKNMEIYDPSNGVTYQNGVFTIPAGVKSFNFGWNLSPMLPGDAGYSGIYDVVLDDPNIKVINTSIPTGTSWSFSDNFISATTPDGIDVPLAKMTVAIIDPSGKAVETIDTTQIGNYQVTYSYGNEKNTVIVTVYKRNGVAGISGTQTTTYNGQSQALDVSHYQIILSDGTIYQLQAGDLALTDEAKNAGSYGVTLTTQGLDNIEKVGQDNLYSWRTDSGTASFVINKAPVIIQANDATKISGQTDPQLSAAVTLPSDLVNGDPVIYTITRQTGEAVGNYPVIILFDATKNPNYQIQVENGTFKITPNHQTINGSDYTMYIGDPMPTATDFKASVTDDNGQELPVMIDLSQAKLDQVGVYPVKLSTTDAQTKNIQLTVLNRSSGGSSSTNGMAANPPQDDQSVEPTVPETPVEPSEPEKVQPSEPEVLKPTTSTPSDSEKGQVTQKTSFSNNKIPVNYPSRQIIISGEIYYVPNENKLVGQIVKPKATSQVDELTGDQNVNDPNVLPQMSNEKGTFESVIGWIIGLLTLLGIDLKKHCKI